MVKLSQKTDKSFQGEIVVSPDKSISHRSLIFSALANGTSKICNILEGEDVLHTAQALRSMGVDIVKQDQIYVVKGVGLLGLQEPSDILDMGNSGTSTRLLAGLVTPYNFTTFFTGDASLRLRPMTRIFQPIEQFGAKIISRNNNLLPFAVCGAKNPLPIEYKMNIASAQVKSCILLASMAIQGITTIIEPEKCRDHSEIMMRYLGLKIITEKFSSGLKHSYQGLQEFDAKDFDIPNDISSASFFIVACLLSKNSHVTLKNVGINPLRTGIITTLQEMDANIEIVNQKEINGELVADIVVESSNLKAVEVPASRSASMIDEYPILAIACANAKGVSKLNGLAELKTKESNRLLMIAQNLEKCGVNIKLANDSLEISGGVVQPKQRIFIRTAMDHRIAMSFLIMGLTLENGIEIDDDQMIKTSFPSFEKIFSQVLT
ncbi:3-phosphoshikimate 1-carboxyvinyltransferase [Alphaproteobacteria bacterium]|nr:3-phosphoshikimate 1-carboxyvinyltransferase [Alphaproteobacteria bacterium]